MNIHEFEKKPKASVKFNIRKEKALKIQFDRGLACEVCALPPLGVDWKAHV